MPTRDVSWIYEAVINKPEALLIIAEGIHDTSCGRHGVANLYHGNRDECLVNDGNIGVNDCHSEAH